MKESSKFNKKKVIIVHNLMKLQKIPEKRLMDIIPYAHKVTELDVWSEHFKSTGTPFAITQEFNINSSPTKPDHYRYRLWKERRI